MCNVQRRCIKNLGAILEAAGSSLEDVVEVNVFLADMGDFGKVNEAYEEFFGDVKPSRTYARTSDRHCQREIVMRKRLTAGTGV